MIVAIDAGHEEAALATLDELGESAWRIGYIEDGAGPVTFR
jgi:phosphoribosylaminoimidazole (AIR) synthetase